MSFGLPYQGSKNKIAKNIISHLPSGNRFVDLFAGGCSMTHCAILSGKYKCFLANDIDGRMPSTFKDAIDGKYANERRWISRNDFFKLKDSDIYARLCFSFGNDSKTYMYGKELEPYKKACHYAIVFDEWDDFKRLCPDTVEFAMCSLSRMPMSNWMEIQKRRLMLGPSIVDRIKNINMSVEEIHSNPLYKSIKNTNPKYGDKEPHKYCVCENLERLNRLENLERLCCSSLLESTSFDYREYKYQEGDVVYCDPPYFGTKNYGGNQFDSNAFYEWVRTRDYPVYFSEYNAPSDFICVFGIDKYREMSIGVGSKDKMVEKLFINHSDI